MSKEKGRMKKNLYDLTNIITMHLQWLPAKSNKAMTNIHRYV